MREKVIENKIKTALASLGINCWFFKHAASAAMKVGIPDIICCIKGRFVGIEVKQENVYNLMLKRLLVKIYEKLAASTGLFGLMKIL